MSRISPPLHLPGATEFSADRDLLSPVWLVRTLKQTAWLWRELEDGTRLDKNWGRRKEPGHWALAFLAFVVSGQVDVEPWWTQTSPDLWRECGFAARPSYQTTYERFCELEGVSAEFTRVAGRLIQHCRKHDDNIGNHVHVDGTEAETHAFLHHDCQEGEGCSLPHWGRKRLRAKRESTARVREERHKESDSAPSDELDIGEAEEVQVVDGRLRVKSGGHWFRTADSSAGVRAYKGPRGARKFWHGFYNQKAIDHYTGAPLAVGVYNASKQEYHVYPELFDRLVKTMGRTPQTIVADRGFSVESVFAHNTSNGVASVIPWRRKNQHESQRHDHDTHDRHGIPRCKHCGAPTVFVRFSAKQGTRMWFRCARQTTPQCHGQQSMVCSKDWRLLLPLWRTDAVYHELEESHQSYERVHRHWRDRYKVAGDTLACRPKRRGLAWQELRAQAALLAEWTMIAFREGWLGSARRNRKNATRNDAIGIRRVKNLLRFRHKVGLDNPYGKSADALGIGHEKPPSRRILAPPGDDDSPGVPF